MKTTHSISALGSLVAILTVGCGGEIGYEEADGIARNDGALVGQTALAPLKPRLEVPAARPNDGVVGRGFNRRVPVTRLEFQPGTVLKGGWHEHLATDRGLCTEFASGVKSTVGAANPFSVEAGARVIKSEDSLKLVQSGSIAATANVDIVLPVEGVPIPVGAHIDDAFGVDVAQNGSSDAFNATFYAIARGPTIYGDGPAKLRQSVLDNVTLLPVAKRANAFFAQCGDSYLDQLSLGGMVAIDVSIFSSTGEGVIKQKLAIQRALNVGPEVEDLGSDPALLQSLLNIIGIDGSASASGTTNIQYQGETTSVTFRIRSMGPTLPDNLTVDGALALVKNWGTYVENHQSKLAVMGATLQLYAGVENSQALGVALPAFGDDGGYNLLMEELNRYYMRHYAMLLNFGFMERIRSENGDNAERNRDIWFVDSDSPLPSLSAVRNARSAALVNAFAVAQAQQCLMALPPGSSTASSSACLWQERLGEPAKSWFRKVTGIIDLPVSDSTKVNVKNLGYGSYPALNERRGVVHIGKTWDDFYVPLEDLGYGPSITFQRDHALNACLIEQQGNDVAFISGRTDDYDIFTDSLCRFRLWNDLPLKSGWSASGAWDFVGTGAAGGVAFPGSKISGEVRAEHDFRFEAGARLHSITLVGPLPKSNDFEFESATRELDYALDL